VELKIFSFQKPVMIGRNWRYDLGKATNAASSSDLPAYP
jgi:hypothetical protein